MFKIKAGTPKNHLNEDLQFGTSYKRKAADISTKLHAIKHPKVPN